MVPPRRDLFNLAKRFVVENIDIDPLGLNAENSPPRLTFEALTKIMPLMSRTREKILNNLDEMYREAFERAKASGDATQMATLDFAYRREQLYFEILLDVRDAVERR
ncbi:MAG: hypothetical protein ACJ79K_10795 [Gemmatimonadaceae bacterium]